MDRTRRLELAQSGADCAFGMWIHEIGRPKNTALAALEDPRTKEAISLLADVMGDLEGAADAGGKIEDETFIEEEDGA